MASKRQNPSIVMTSPPREHGVSQHPRRAPAARSVSLLHSSRPLPTRYKSDSSSENEPPKPFHISQEGAVVDSPSSLNPLGGKDSSGESSNAEKWFEKSNNEVRDNSASFADNDPPFFMRNSSSSETPPDAQVHLKNLIFDDDRANSLPLQTGLLQLGTDGSSTEDFRSVIDDLTIENKKLKRRLKKYEKLHDSHLKDEKLFEVRIHGLPAEKKRELEETLRKFASGLGPNAGNAFPPNRYTSLLPMLKATKTSSSQTSLQNTDSAYASMSASGQGSAQGNDGKQKLTPTQYLSSRRQNIHSYLHHIPEGLMPQQNPATMTERAKKKLVVRRMEQLFAGKGAAANGHQQSLQQQEISQSAARTDRSAIEAAGERVRNEGSREAHIMEGETEDPVESKEKKEKQPGPPQTVQQPSKKHGRRKEVPERSPAQGSFEQRPTRPLDLDPHRAQVPAENIRYMRHLGFSPPDPESAKTPEDGHGWIYLNFLINMAQLHTINVTSDFVRKALNDYSDKFEVSQDGRKVRWKGRGSITRTSSSGGGSSNDRISDDTPEDQSPRKRLKLSQGGALRTNLNGGLQPSGSALQRPHSESNKHVYTPLFFHKDSTDDADDSSSEEEDDSMSSPFPAPVGGDSTGMTSSGIRTNSGPRAPPPKKKQKGNDGPIIFYNNARFCTDLSGDRRTDGNQNAPIYTRASAFPVGKRPAPGQGLAEKRGPLAQASELPEPMDISDNPIPASMELSFPPRSPPKPSSPAKDQIPIELEVTGIGGVWPSDNFAISVESRHAQVDQQDSPGISHDGTAKTLPPQFAKIMAESDTSSKRRPALHKHFVTSKVQNLPPSELPPALGFFPDDDGSMDEDSDVDDDKSDTPESPGALPPAAAPQPVDIPFSSSDDEEEEDEEEDDDDEDDKDEDEDDEVDFLAAVREIDPEAIRQKEREYDATMAERVAEEIPPGSSAATAGGGSGFNSPMSGTNREEYQVAMQDARKRRPGLQRARTDDSIVVQRMQDASSSSDGEGEVSNVSS